MKAELTIIPTISIHPDKIITYNQVSWSPCRPSKKYYGTGLEFLKDDDEQDQESKQNKADRILKSDRKSHGIVSIQAKRKMTRAVDYLLTTSSEQKASFRLSGRQFQFRIAFITLTLPSSQYRTCAEINEYLSIYQDDIDNNKISIDEIDKIHIRHSDKEIKNECLNQFLIEIQKYHKVTKYVWRSERQSNGNIHFHILVNKFIGWNDIRNRWNRIINKLGYVNRYQDKMKEYFKSGFKLSANRNDKRPAKQQYKAYLANKKTDFNNPNSTDIHSIRQIHNIKLYIVKYLAKQNEDQKQLKQPENQNQYEAGRIWGCSQILSNITGARMEMDNKSIGEMEKILSHSEINRYEADYFTVFYIDFDQLPGLKCEYLFKEFCQYLIQKFNYNYQLST